MQLQILWEEIMARFPVIEVMDEPGRIYSNFIHGISSLPVRIRRFVPVARRRLLIYAKAIESVKRSWMSLLRSPADPMRRADAMAGMSTTML